MPSLRLSKQIQEFEFEKNYQAVVCGNLKEDFGTFEDYLLKNGKTNKTEVVKAGTPDAKKAELDYELIDCIETKEGILTWVLVILHTGRHHQIRVQFASRGLGLYGDTKYNPAFQKTKKKYTEIGLYSTRLSFLHPVTGERMTFKTEPCGEAFEKDGRGGFLSLHILDKSEDLFYNKKQTDSVDCCGNLSSNPLYLPEVFSRYS